METTTVKRKTKNAIKAVKTRKTLNILGNLYFVKKATKGRRALIIIKAIKRENIKSLISHKKLRRRIKTIVKIIVFEEISIFRIPIYYHIFHILHILSFCNCYCINRNKVIFF